MPSWKADHRAHPFQVPAGRVSGEEEDPPDPWSNPYVYVCPGLHGDFDIISYGADGKRRRRQGCGHQQLGSVLTVTLMELIVCIFIISLVLAVSFPSLHSGKTGN